MGHVVIKQAPDLDEYVYWSTIVEAPINYGTRADMVIILDHDHRVGGSPHDSVEERLARADATGTSMYGLPLGYGLGEWDDESLIYEQRGHLPRKHLFRAAQLIDHDREPEVWDLMTPFEDETEVRRG